MVPDNQTGLDVNQLVSVCPNAILERIQRETVFGSYLAPWSGTTAQLSGALYDPVGKCARTGQLHRNPYLHGPRALEKPG